MNAPRDIRLLGLLAALATGCSHTSRTGASTLGGAPAGGADAAEALSVIARLEPQRESLIARMQDEVWDNDAMGALFDLGDAYEDVGAFDDADRMFGAVEDAAQQTGLPGLMIAQATLLRAHVAFARGAYPQALTIYGALCDAVPEDEPHAEMIANACWWLPLVGAEAGDVSVLARIPALPDHDPRHAARVRTRAYVLSMLGRTADAQAELRRVVPSLDVVADIESIDARTLGVVAFALGRFDVAMEAHRRELEIDEALARADGQPLATHAESGDVAYLVRAGLAANRPDAVCPRAELALAHMRHAHGEGHPETGLMHLRVAQCALALGDRAKVQAESARALASFATSAPAYPPRVEAEAFAREFGGD